MITLRIVLIIVGVLLIVAIYFYSKRTSTKVRESSHDFSDTRFERTEIRNEPVWENQDDVDIAESDFESALHQPEMPDINLAMLSDLVREAAKESGRGIRPSSVIHEKSIEKPNTPGIKSDKPSLLLNGNLLIIHLLAKDKAGFYGQDLLNVFNENDFEFGKMRIFHYYSNESDQVLFSVVNIIKPGHFDLDDMENFSTPGVSFFMQLDMLDYPVRAFELMLKTVWNIAEIFDARICDMNHSSLTPQTATFLHEEVKEFQRNSPNH